MTAIGIVGCSSKNKEPNLPDYTGFVNDYTGKIDKEWLERTEQLVRNVEKGTSYTRLNNLLSMLNTC